MIKNLLVNGCSFSACSEMHTTWGDRLVKALDIKNYLNPGEAGAGNYFICNSTIEGLECQRWVPSETFVLVMWSGLSRMDFRVSGEFYDQNTDYIARSRVTNRRELSYIFSGGIRNSWQTANPAVKDLFKTYYLATDIWSLCKFNLDCFNRLKMYLDTKGYRYRFMNIHNFWSTGEELPVDPEFILTKHFDFTEQYFQDWLFTTDNFGGLYEYVKTKKLLESDNWHPSNQGYQYFVDSFLLEKIRDLL